MFAVHIDYELRHISPVMRKPYTICTSHAGTASSMSQQQPRSISPSKSEPLSVQLSAKSVPGSKPPKASNTTAGRQAGRHVATAPLCHLLKSVIHSTKPRQRVLWSFSGAFLQASSSCKHQHALRSSKDLLGEQPLYLSPHQFNPKYCRSIMRLLHAGLSLTLRSLSK